MSEKDRVHRLSRTLQVLATLAVAGQLVGLYRATGPPQPSWFPALDKVEHVVGFAGPVCLLLAARSRRAVENDRYRASGPSPASDSRFVVVVTGVFALHAVVSELIQHFFYRYRTGDPFDVLADLAGVAFGLGLARLLRTRGKGWQSGVDGRMPAGSGRGQP